MRARHGLARLPAALAAGRRLPAAAAGLRRAGPAAGARRPSAASARLVGRSPRRDLPSLIEDVFGVDVAVIELERGFDGLAASSGEAKLIVLATSHGPGRQRYTSRMSSVICSLATTKRSTWTRTSSTGRRPETPARRGPTASPPPS